MARGNVCLNCRSNVAENYCGNCGQQIVQHRSLVALTHDLMHSVVHLDGKLFSTLPLLIFRPGELTYRYIVGERTKFVSPMSMFLFIVFAMFIVFQLTAVSAYADKNLVNDEREQLLREAVKRQVALLEAEHLTLGTPESRREEIVIELEGLNSVLDREFPPSKFIEELEFSTGIASLDFILQDKWKQNRRLMLYKLQSNFYKFCWLLIPLSVPGLWIIFARCKKYRVYDHAIFVTYSLSFMFSLLIVSSVISYWFYHYLVALIILFSLIASCHLFFHLRETYQLSTFSASWIFCILILWIHVVMFLFFYLLIGVGAL